MIDADLPGITIQPQYLLSAQSEGADEQATRTSSFFDNVRVPAIAGSARKTAGR